MGYTLPRELVRESRRPNKKPLAFAMIANGEPFVQIIHGFAEMTMETDTHPCDGLLGGFIGDRMVIALEGAQVVHEPPFVMICEDTFIHSVKVRPASDSAIKKMKANERLLPPGRTTAEQELPGIMPLPLLPWIPYFLEQRRSTVEAYIYMRKKLAKGKDDGDDDIKLFYTVIVGWFSRRHVQRTCPGESTASSTPSRGRSRMTGKVQNAPPLHLARAANTHDNRGPGTRAGIGRIGDTNGQAKPGFVRPDPHLVFKCVRENT
jgi:hypothetical protein